MEIIHVQNPKQLDIFREVCFDYYAYILEKYAVDMGYEYFKNEMASLPGEYVPPKGCLLLAIDGEMADGCGGLRSINAETGELKRVFVRPKYQGRGIGRALSKELIAVGREIGYLILQVHTARFLTEAMNMYQELGFQELRKPESSEVILELSIS